MKKELVCKVMVTAVVVSGAGISSAGAQSADALVNKLVQKGILTRDEAKELMAEASQTNLVSASKWKLGDSLKNIQLYGDVRFRYEMRSAGNSPLATGVEGSSYDRERFRYALRIGLKGDLFDNFFYGIRVETSSNPRSTWVTFGDDTNPTPSAKNNDSINLGQLYLGWRPTDWYEMIVGRMPMPLYVTPMTWDGDINPEGAVEKVKYTLGPAELFASFGQFLYQDTNPDHQIPSDDTFLLAWQVGANVKLAENVSLKVAPVVYNYTGRGGGGGLNRTFTGQGDANGSNTNSGGAYNQSGLNNLLVLETPAELNIKVGPYQGRLFGDFAYNFKGADRARAAAQAAPEELAGAATGEDKAYQIGLGFGNLGLVYGQTSKRNTWEARVYWQHVEQYAVDVNLLDSDFFEGRANLQGVYAAFAYSFTDSIIGTVRYGYAQRINDQLGTGGNNPDLPGLNPIRNYHLIQLDLTWRF